MADIILAGVDDKVLITVCCGAVIFFIGVLMIIFQYRNSSSSHQNIQRENRENLQSYNDICPICLSIHRLAVETNCGHKFCGSCFKTYLNQRPGDFSLFREPVSCSLCRQKVNILFLNFTSEESVLPDLENERSEVERIVSEYNIRFGNGPRTAWSYINDCPVLLRHMVIDFFTSGGLVWMFRLRVILCCLGAFIYFFNPVDFIPESMFGIFGFLDDVLVFLFFVIYVSIIYRQLVINRGSEET